MELQKLTEQEVQNLRKGLLEREEFILLCRYCGVKSSLIADMMKVSRQRVEQLERSLEKRLGLEIRKRTASNQRIRAERLKA
jgi:helix-turn-helix protein